MFYIGKSKELKSYIVGQTQYSQYFRSETHFRNSINRIGIEKEKFDYFEVFSLPGEEDSFNLKIKELNEKGYSPLNKSLKYLNLLFEITGDKEVFLKAKNNQFNRCIKNTVSKGKTAYGENGRVLLTDKQYQKLCEDFSKEQVEDVIPYLDEYLEGNNNKNGYTNFYILMKRAIRENWYNTRAKYNKEHVEAKSVQEAPEEVKEFLKNIK